MQDRIQGLRTINDPRVPSLAENVSSPKDLDGSGQVRRRGRRADPEQIKNDAKVWEAWRTGQYATYADLARELKSFSTGPQANKGLTSKDIELAIGRHEKHRKRIAEQ
jgi:hypothetical protein